MNVCLLEGEGGALFVWRGPQIYEVHVFFEQRGREVLDLSHRMLEAMRAHGAGCSGRRSRSNPATSSCSPA
jgi:hypothetical protein